MICQADFKVSIIITSYNQASYLVEALESVMAQSLPPFEIIVSDDGSTDESPELLRKFARKYPDWIIPFIHENVGIPRNRNIALQRVRGNFVGILDGDDRFRSQKLEKQFEALNRVKGARAVYGNFSRFAEGQGIVSFRYDKPQPEGDILGSVADLNFGLIRTMVVETDAMKAAGFMDVNLPKYDGLWLSIILASFCQIAYVDDVIVDKRLHADGDSKKNLHQDIKDVSLIFNRVQKMINHLPKEQKEKIYGRYKRVIRRLKSPI